MSQNIPLQIRIYDNLQLFYGPYHSCFTPNWLTYLHLSWLRAINVINSSNLRSMFIHAPQQGSLPFCPDYKPRFMFYCHFFNGIDRKTMIVSSYKPQGMQTLNRSANISVPNFPMDFAGNMETAQYDIFVMEQKTTG